MMERVLFFFYIYFILLILLGSLLDKLCRIPAGIRNEIRKGIEVKDAQFY